jgi:AraC-like DNA-binding protein
VRTLADVDRQIATSFRARLAAVLATEPGNHVESILAEIGADPAAFERDDGVATDIDLSELLHALNSPERFPGIGLDFGLARRILDLGLVGYTALSCNSIGSALNVITRYHALTSDAYQVNRSEDDTGVVFRLWIRPIHRERRVVIGEEFATGFWQILKELLPIGTDLSDVGLSFDYPSPPYGPRYRELMPCRIQFEETHTSVAIPDSLLRLSVETADETVEQVCRVQCDQILAGLDTGQRVTDDVRRLLASVPSNRPMSLGDVAHAMLTSPRTLERRLHEAGTTFRSLDLEVRMGLAAQYLELGSMSSQEISNVLGYSRSSAFFRAFKAWFGVTPRQYRAASPSES